MGQGLELPPESCPRISLKQLQCGTVSEPHLEILVGFWVRFPSPPVAFAVFPTHSAVKLDKLSPSWTNLYLIYLEGLRLHPLLPSSGLASPGPPNHSLGWKRGVGSEGGVWGLFFNHSFF